MKDTTNAVVDTITNDHANVVGTVVHAEWQMNRFYNTLVDNTPSEDDEAYDIEYFPIESISEPNRPTSGICKAVAGQAIVEPRLHDGVPASRFYTVDAEDEYQYWQSPVSAGANGVFPLFTEANFPAPDGEVYTYDGLTPVRPEVVYATENTENAEGEEVPGTPIDITVNKITYTVENTFAYPTDYDVQIKTTTTGWTTVASDVAIPDNGKVELWHNGTNWTTTPNLDGGRIISGVRLVVRQMNKKAFFNLIELGACLERDLSADLVAWNDAFTMGENDFITPLGNISSNTGQVTLFNGEDDLYRNNNDNSPYFGILDKGVIFRAWMKYDTDLVQEFEMFSDTWDESDENTTISLVDGASFFMETKPRPVLYQNISVQEAIWRICDIIGFTNYEVSPVPEAPVAPVYTPEPVFRQAGHTTETQAQFKARYKAWREPYRAYEAALKKYRSHPGVIDIFWTDGEKTAWEIFGELSRATQTAIYFDSYGKLQVRTRDSAWDAEKPVDYTFIRESIPGGQPANIVSLTETTVAEANKVTVNWQQTGFSEARDNIVPFEVVWEPEGDVVMRATNLAKHLLIGDEVVYLQSKEGKTWPWTGMMNLEGEWISFNAKRYVHYENGQRKASWVEDYDEQKKLDARGGASYRHLHRYTGALRIEERGLFGTEEKNHRIDLQHWNKVRQRNYNTNNTTNAGFKLNTRQSSVTIATPKKFDMNDYAYMYHGSPNDRGYKYFGFRMKIDKSGHKDKVGGMFFGGDDGLGSGYFLEVMATSRMNGKMRNKRNEVRFYSMKANGAKKVIGGQTIRMKDKSKNHKKGAKIKKDIGARQAVVANRYIDFDIWYRKGDSADSVQVFANGRKIMDARIEGTWKHANVGRMGLFARGHSSVTFDYVYAINSPGREMIDSESYYDRIEGGYYSTQANDWTWDTREARRRVKKRKKKRKKGRRKWKWVWKKYTQRYKQRFYDDFGPIAHEAREFEVKFADSLPVLESKLYFSNTTQAVCTEFAGDISGATFIMGNISRDPAVVNGDDERTSKGNGTINHKLFVYGRPVIQKNAQQIVKEDAKAIRRRGPIEVEYSSPWIQNEGEAERFAHWLTTHWSNSDSTLEIEVFGNPLIELGDTVQVNYKHIDAQFWVVGVTNTYEQGLTTTLSLRKARDLS